MENTPGHSGPASDSVITFASRAKRLQWLGALALAAVIAAAAAAAWAEHAAIMGENPLHNSARYSLEAHLRSAVGR